MTVNLNRPRARNGVPELKGDKVAFFTEMNQALVESGVSHFSCATVIKLLSLSNK